MTRPTPIAVGIDERAWYVGDADEDPRDMPARQKPAGSRGGVKIPPRTVARLEEWATITILSRAAAAQRQRAAGARGATVLCSERAQYPSVFALLGTIHSRLATRDRRRRDRRRNRRSALLAQRHVHSASHQRPRAAQGRQPGFLREFVESSKGWGWLPTHADGDMTCDATCDAPCDVRVVL